MEELFTAWRALESPTGVEGWRTIPITHGARYCLLAGRHFPGSQESLLVGFRGVHMPPSDQLPQSQGFLVSNADLGQLAADLAWMSLTRQPSGTFDLFATVASDIVSTLKSVESADEQKVFRIFLGRIRAWQDFMHRPVEEYLGPEAEIGLFGELEVLRELLLADVSPPVAVDSWLGPLGGVHDFSAGGGAIEVKTTASSGSFVATIGSLDQLDDSVVRPVFLACVRLALGTLGRTLSQQVDDLRAQLHQDSVAAANFNNRLLHAGYYIGTANRYRRRFERTELRVLSVEDGVPRLTRATVPGGILKARYEVEVSSSSRADVEFKMALQQLKWV